MRFLLIVLLLSCSPINRHARIVKKFPYVHTIDSIRLIDTIKINTTKIEIDTIVSYNDLIDTVFLNKENLKVKVYTVKDSIYIFGKCDTIFIDKIIERKIPIKYYKTKNSLNTTLLLWLIVLVLIMVLYVWNKLQK
jgi:hypothetical protein